MHISEATLAELANRGWKVKDQIARKLFLGYQEAGILSDGNIFVTVEFDDSGRWLTQYSGFNVAFDLDSRDYFNDPVKFADDIEAKILELKN